MTGVVRLHAGGNGAGLPGPAKQVVQGDLGQVRRQPASPSRPRVIWTSRLAELLMILYAKGWAATPLGQFPTVCADHPSGPAGFVGHSLFPEYITSNT